MRRVLLIAIAVVCAGTLGWAAFVVGTADDHRTNVKYILWKHHLWAYDPGLVGYLIVDNEFRESLKGKTRAEILRWFPVLQPVDKAEVFLPYTPEVESHPGFVWIDSKQSWWGLDFEGDRVRDVVLIKG